MKKEKKSKRKFVIILKFLLSILIMTTSFGIKQLKAWKLSQKVEQDVKSVFSSDF